MRAIVCGVSLAGRAPNTTWPVPAAVVAVLAVAFATFELLPAVAIRLWVPVADQEIATAVVVAVKNPTVIALTILWLTGVGRCLIAAGGDRTDWPR